MSWLFNFNIYIQGLIIGSIILLLISVMLGVMVYRKNDLKPDTITYLSSFTGGILIVAAFAGQLISARDNLIKYFENINSSYGKINVSPTALQTIIILSIFLAGIIFAFMLIQLINWIHGKIHDHEHKLIISKKESKIEKSLIMILLHRLPSGLVMGGLIFLANKVLPNGMSANPLSLATLIIFIVHIIPESIYAYYNYQKIKRNKIKSFIFVFITAFSFIPLIIFGIFIFKIVPSELIYLRNILFIGTGFIIIWAVLTEIFPDILSNRDKKEFKKIILFFVMGFIISLFFQTIHIH